MDYSLHPNKPSHAFLGVSIATGILTVLATNCVALRFIHRKRTVGLWWDDWTILGALVFGIGVFINTVLSTLPNLGASGYHLTEYTVDGLATWFKLCLAGEVLYNFSIALSKISVILFYRRIFSIDGHFLLFMRIMMALIAALCLASVFGLIFSTHPVEAQWNVLLPHTSINTTIFYDTTAAINIAIDLAIFGLVQRKVWGLHADINRRTLLSILLLLGAFSVIASILRLVYLLIIDYTDITYSLTPAWLWTVVEGLLYIICACLPIVYSFFRSISGRQTSASSKFSDQQDHVRITIGSGPKRPKNTMDSNESDVTLTRTKYQVTCEPGQESMTCHEMSAASPVHVRRDYEVTSV